MLGAAISAGLQPFGVKSVSAQVRASSSRLVGQVVAEGSEEPLAAARVELLGQPRAVTFTDSLGRFTLPALDPGPDTLRVSLPGFTSEKIPVQIEPGASYDVTLVIPYATTTLEELTVEVPGSATERMAGFESRRKLRIGEFVTREEIERRRLDRLSRVLQGLPRVRASQDGVTLLVRGPRGLRSCMPALFVDGLRRDPKLNRIDDLTPASVEGIEVYYAPIIPGRFYDPFYRCGSIVIWTTYGRGSS